MNNWKYKRLSECSNFVSERTSNIAIDNYISTENMIENRGGVKEAAALPDVKSTSAYKPNDILLSNIRPYFCKIWFADKKGSCSNDVLVVRAKKEVDPKFLYYVLSDQNFFNWDSMTSKGTKMPRGTPNAIMKYSVPDIPFHTQEKIASILSAYDNLIQNYKKQIEALQSATSELYKEWFVRFRFPGWQNAKFENGVPEGWKYLKLSEFGYEVESGNRPAGGIDDSLEDGIPSLGAESIDKLGYFDYSNVKLVPREFYDKMKRGHGKDNDILLYKDGAYIGKVTLFRNGFPFKEYAVNEHVFLLRSNNKDYQNYLYFTLNMPQYFTQMQNLNRNAAQPGLARGDLDRIKILVPNEKVIEKFNKLINPMIDNIFSYSKQITNLTQQRDLLLPRLMSGKLEVDI